MGLDIEEVEAVAQTPRPAGCGTALTDRLPSIGNRAVAMLAADVAFGRTLPTQRDLQRFAAIAPALTGPGSNRALARLALLRAPAVCDPTVASCPAGTVAPDGTPNTGTDQAPPSPASSSSASSGAGPASGSSSGARGSGTGGRRRASVCDPSIASCPAGTVAPDGSPNTGTDATPGPVRGVCDPSVSSCLPGTIAPDGSANTGGDQLPGATLVPRPPGIPLDQGVQLIPVPGLPAGLVDQLPEGQIVTVAAPAAPASATSSTGGGTLLPRTLQTAGAASGGAILAANYQTMNYGFASAGPDSLGIVAIPRIQPAFRGGGINPQANPIIDVARPLDAWGHTAMFVRRGGQIEWVRGFNPDMSPGQLPGFLRQAGNVEAGRAAWPGVVENDATMLTSTMAKTVEYPISPELAAEIARGHPVGPGGTGGAPQNYTARPAMFAEGDPLLVCNNTNCIGYAVRAAEQHLGGPIGPQGGGSIVDVGRGGVPAPNTAGQGQLMGMLTDVEAGEVTLAVPPSALGPPVVGSMPGALRYVKWGGRVFLVVGIVAGGYEIATAPEGTRPRTTVGVLGGFAGGFALGATAGLICGPGAPVCSVVLGLGLGIAGGITGRSLAEGLYDAAGSTTSAPVYTDEMNRAAHGGVVCPNCHAPLVRRPMLGPSSSSSVILGAVYSSTPGGSSGGHPETLSDADLRVLSQWLDATPAPTPAASH